jgi:hypothetical protein
MPKKLLQPQKLLKQIPIKMIKIHLMIIILILLHIIDHINHTLEVLTHIENNIQIPIKILHIMEIQMLEYLDMEITQEIDEEL